MKNLLIVEDSTTVTKILKHILKQSTDIKPIFVDSFAAAKKAYEEIGDNLFAAIIDLNLPDAPDGETVDFFLQRKVPSIVLTANYQDDKREELLKKGIVDYIVKESRFSYNYVIKLIDRLGKNQHLKILIAEDSKPARNFIKLLLQRHLYQVLEAENGLEALEILKNNTDIKMLITDYHMPEMDGFELVRAIRQNVDKSGLIIIGLSGDGHGSLSARFIKNGANDFLKKPFNHEEFYCRIMHNMEEMELIEKIRDIASRDFLTGVYNRRYLFEKGSALHTQSQESSNPLAIVMLSIDHFKQISDDYGHEAGDKVLIFLAHELQHAFSRFIISRFEGEKFCIIIPGLNNEQACEFVNKFRGMISSMTIDADEIDDETLHISISAGITNTLQEKFGQQLSYADELLRSAKEAGRDIVIGD
jgi:diguanylate cyclase (GGDEF)-like protein